MSIPPEALQKLVQEIESRAIVAQQQISIVKTQIATKQRDIRLLQLTSSELGSLSKDTNVYEGVGKIRLSSEDQTLKKDISDLEKRLHYLETTHEKSKEHIEQIFRGAAA
uniref:Putative prefoldin subunit 1 n=1 Tax=Talaromyces marneffei PM1 TaxID=1077442 RepID=A0A093XRC3_TALMA